MPDAHAIDDVERIFSQINLGGDLLTNLASWIARGKRARPRAEVGARPKRRRREWRILRSLGAIAFLAGGVACGQLHAATNSAPVACGVAVAASDDEEHDACEAMADVKRLFRPRRRPVELDVTVRFLSSVVIDIASASGVREEIPVIGRFHRHKQRNSDSQGRAHLAIGSTAMEASVDARDRAIDSPPRDRACLHRKLLGDGYDQLPRGLARGARLRGADRSDG